MGKTREVSSWLRNLAFGMFDKLCSREERRECWERVVAGRRHLSDIKVYPSGGLYSEIAHINTSFRPLQGDEDSEKGLHRSQTWKNCLAKQVIKVQHQILGE